ncbi:hypothetical protein CRE_14395 [Caenorhabditis remanei]|uniref:Uncharacterized protein n=1 Tax=Caenorhabditis remanei TaxID=31234 RepID=E3NPD1_CAERE|nr:hypothetical protein CRE_14395 [Caenorhabditis remanei]
MSNNESPSPPPVRANSISATINYLHLDADKVLSAFGKYGRYQMLAYVITTSVHMLFALNMMIMPFITKSITFLCDLPDRETPDSALRPLLRYAPLEIEDLEALAKKEEAQRSSRFSALS